MGPDIRLNLSSDRHLWPALIDLNQLELVILNLAINARDAMPSGGTLSIAVVNGEVPSISPNGVQPPASLMPGQYVVLTVCDTGIGMDAATLVRARLSRSSPPRAWARVNRPRTFDDAGLCPAVSGSHPAAEFAGRGDIDRDVAPARLCGPGGVAQLRAPARGARRGGTLLVCDDDPGVLELVCDALERSGYQAVPVRSGQAALEVLQRDEAISLLIVDFTMPEMNGGLVVRAALADRHPPSDPSHHRQRRH